LNPEIPGERYLQASIYYPGVSVPVVAQPHPSKFDINASFVKLYELDAKQFTDPVYSHCRVAFTPVKGNVSVDV
jgi:hypothetical protein